jgi:hypothetical protein
MMAKQAWTCSVTEKLKKTKFLRKFLHLALHDRLCGLVVRVPGYRSRGARFDSQRYQICKELVGLEWG